MCCIQCPLPYKTLPKDQKHLKQGYPSAMVIDYGVPDTTDVVWVTAPNAFAAETKALDEYRAEQAKKSNKNKGSSTVDALPKDAIIKE